MSLRPVWITWDPAFKQTDKKESGDGGGGSSGDGDAGIGGSDGGSSGDGGGGGGSDDGCCDHFFLRSICNQYNTIAEKVSEIPANTAELVALIEYLRKSSDVTVFKLRRQLRDASERLEFLMDYADLPRKSAPCVYMHACAPM